MLYQDRITACKFGINYGLHRVGIQCWVSLGTVPLTGWIRCWVRLGTVPLTGWIRCWFRLGTVPLTGWIRCWVSLGTVPLTGWIRCWVSLGTVPLTGWIRFGYNTVPVLEPRIRVLKCSSRAEKATTLKVQSLYLEKNIPGHFFIS